MRGSHGSIVNHAFRIAIASVVALAGASASAQSVHEAPAAAPSTGRVAPQGEPGQPLRVTGVVVGPDGAPIGGASLYIYQTDHEGYYGVKPASDNRNPRLKLFLRSDAQGRMVVRHRQAWLVPEQPRSVAHPLRGVGARPRLEDFRDRVRRRSVRDGRMRSDPAFSVRPISGGAVTERIVLSRRPPRRARQPTVPSSDNGCTLIAAGGLPWPRKRLPSSHPARC